MRIHLFLSSALALAACAREHDSAVDAPLAPTSDSPAPAAPAPTAPASPTTENPSAMATSKQDGILGMSYTSLEGKDVPFSTYQGKVLLLVNVASECGYTPQYKGLEALHESLGPKGLVVVGFPSNEFGKQEPGSAEEIRQFCTEKYSVKFPLAAKVEVKPGAGQSPVYQYLTNATGSVPGWNFCKYLIGKDGKIIGFYPSKTTPEALQPEIEKALAAQG